MLIMGVDPGPNQSACAIWNTLNQQIVNYGQYPNNEFRTIVKNFNHNNCVDICVIEDMAFYGKVQNRESFETLKFIGRLQEIFLNNHSLVYFPDIAYHFCNSRRGVKTSHINAVLTDRFGGKGTKKKPGLLWGIREHIWSALAVCIYWADITRDEGHGKKSRVAEK